MTENKTERIKLDLEDPASPYVFGHLAGGIVDDEGKIHRTFSVEEMTGIEEDLLAARGPLIERLNQIISNCVTSIGDVDEKPTIRRIVRNLPAVDRVILLVGIRRATHGDIFQFHTECPRDKCGFTNVAKINLGKLEIVEMPNPGERSKTTTLRSGRKVRWHVMTGRDEKWIRDNAREDRRDVLSLHLLARVDAIENTQTGEMEPLNRKSGHKEALLKVKRMKMSERQELRRRFAEEEGSYDTEIEIRCQGCMKDYSVEMDVSNENFFSPSEESMS